MNNTTAAITIHDAFSGPAIKRNKYIHGGFADRLVTKKEFKAWFMARPENKKCSGREVTRAFNEQIKEAGEKARRAAVQFFSDPNNIVIGNRVNKHGNKGALSYMMKNSIKETAPKGRTISSKQIKETITTLSEKDKEELLEQLMASLK